MQTWPQPPSKEEVERVIKTFFGHLQAGRFAEAHDSVGHACDDWEDTLYTVWQDHHLIHAIPKDNSFEGREWATDLAWLKDLSILDKMEWMSEDRVWADLTFKGEPSGYIGEFCIEPVPEGYRVQRVILKMA
jgi:hypothetical protein